MWFISQFFVWIHTLKILSALFFILNRAVNDMNSHRGSQKLTSNRNLFKILYTISTRIIVDNAKIYRANFRPKSYNFHRKSSDKNTFNEHHR